MARQPNKPEKPPVMPLREDQWIEYEVPDNHVMLIGRVVVRWSRLEAVIDDTIWMLLGLDDEEGKAATKKLPTQAKLTRLREACETIADERTREVLGKVVDRIEELKDGRNFIVHGLWGVIMPEGVPTAALLKVDAEPGQIVSEGFDRARMDAILEEIERCKLWLIALPKRIGEPRRVPE